MLDGKEHPMGKSMQFLLMQISRHHAAIGYHQITERGIQPTQMPFLIMLYRHDGCSQKEMAQWLRIKPPTVNVSIQRLEKSGVVERRHDETDRRIARIYLTEEGKNILQEILEDVEETEKIMFGNFSDTELCLLRRFFEQILKNMEEIPDKFFCEEEFMMHQEKDIKKGLKK